MLYFYIILFLVLLLIELYVCIREIEVNRRNPMPKFDDVDKDFNTITVLKTRDIALDREQKGNIGMRKSCRIDRGINRFRINKF